QLCFGVLELAQRLFPFGFEATCDKTVVWIDGAITALGAMRLIGRTLHRETPLRQRSVAVGLDPVGGGDRGFDAQRCERSQHCLRHCIIDLDGSGAETVEAASILDPVAGAVVTRRSGAASIMGEQLASAVPADGHTLQQGGSLSHCAGA